MIRSEVSHRDTERIGNLLDRVGLDLMITIQQLHDTTLGDPRSARKFVPADAAFFKSLNNICPNNLC